MTQPTQSVQVVVLELEVQIEVVTVLSILCFAHARLLVIVHILALSSKNIRVQVAKGASDQVNHDVGLLDRVQTNDVPVLLTTRPPVFD